MNKLEEIREIIKKRTEERKAAMEHMKEIRREMIAEKKLHAEEVLEEANK